MLTSRTVEGIASEERDVRRERCRRGRRSSREEESSGGRRKQRRSGILLPGGGPGGELAGETGCTSGFSLVLSPCRWRRPHRIVGHLPAAGMEGVSEGRPIAGLQAELPAARMV